MNISVVNKFEKSKKTFVNYSKKPKVVFIDTKECYYCHTTNVKEAKEPILGIPGCEKWICVECSDEQWAEDLVKRHPGIIQKNNSTSKHIRSILHI